MYHGIGRALRATRLRKSLRDKLSRVVDEAVSRHFAGHAARLDALGREIAELRRELAGEVRGQGDRLVEHASQVEHRARRDLLFAGEAEAARRSAAFVREQLANARSFPEPHRTLEHALTLAPQGGMALEFGVYSGTTLKIIADARAGERVYGFDSFEGLPETWRSGFPAGTFDVDSLPDVPGSELVVGWFDEVLPGFLDTHPGPVDFLHVDCDLYSSTKTVLDLVGPRLRPGSVVIFDEYFNYPGWPDHEHRAWQEYVERTGLRFEYEAYTIDHEQVVVKVTG
ncbi:class I SAM-dependent methyltransferase [Amycolatopsis sp. NPDC059027]|uniref:class I SAM-dependent methyltransferase n=1 Tax=unclassified Amycolatopsis TaxID=2618356 RepID=UPI003671F5D1